ncbi:uncharacterized protein LOC121786249 [Salvia splendens]|uniref:uncharacterized protein LOC121786249 n=1 Tax=Salvia splendens TaxID=180675 RepID=UPI001C252517|nr:uncharacterized protein LOC121786249 [Salvia splendens]
MNKVLKDSNSDIVLRRLRPLASSAALMNRRLSRRNKLLHSMRVKHGHSIPPILITGHQFTMISQHQTAAREYLQAYKLMPDDPLINLCGGTALINLSLGLRLQNKHQTFLQWLAFLYNNLRLCGDIIGTTNFIL